MKLTGIIEDVFRGVTIFRGYATLKTLAKLSASTNYQRSHNHDRIGDIRRYMSESQFLFFPELILGWQIEDIEAIRKIKEDESASSILIENGIKIKKARFKFKGIVDGEEPKTKVVTVEIPNNIPSPIFNRIDGNHRLVVVDKILTGESETDYGDICNQVVPFCLIIQTKDINNEAAKREAAFFYLINSKAKPLTTDENLRAILIDNLFSSIEKQSLLKLNETQIQYIEALGKSLSENTIDFLTEVFDKYYYFFSVALVRSVIQNDDIYDDSKLKKILNAVKYVNSVFVTQKIKKPTKDILLALTIVYLNEENSFETFLEWVNKNEIGNIHELFYENIVTVFDNIHKQRAYKVFVAMPYISFKRVNEFNTLFKEILSDISRKTGFGLELIPIMRFRGESQRIDYRLIQKIKECDIFIGDLSTVNDNVIFEVGLAEGCNKKILLIKSEEDTKQLPFDEATNLDKGKIIPFDMDKLQYIPYSNSGYYNEIKRIMQNNIPEIIKQLRKEL